MDNNTDNVTTIMFLTVCCSKEKDQKLHTSETKGNGPKTKYWHARIFFTLENI